MGEIIHKSLKKGELPKYLYILEWRDITQYDSLALGEEASLYHFHSSGCIISDLKDKVDLQQTWAVESEMDTKVSSVQHANVLLSLPKGVIKNTYVYKLAGKLEDMKKKKKKPQVS